MPAANPKPFKGLQGAAVWHLKCSDSPEGVIAL